MTNTEKPEASDELKAAAKEAAAQAIADQFAVTDAWRPKPRVRFIVNCPSGQPVLVQHLNTLDLLEADLIDELDYFAKRLFPAEDAKPETEEEAQSAVWKSLRDIEKRLRFYKLLNRLLVVSCVRPRVVDDGVAIVENREGKKIIKLGTKKVDLKEGQVYASSVDFVDRMVIFGELNKPLSEIKPFRGKPNAVVASVEPSKNAERKT